MGPKQFFSNVNISNKIRSPSAYKFAVRETSIFFKLLLLQIIGRVLNRIKPIADRPCNLQHNVLIHTH